MNRFQMLCMCIAIAFMENGATGFTQRRIGRTVAPNAMGTSARPTTTASALYMLDLSGISETSSALTSVVSSSGVILAETEPWVQPLSLVLGPFLNFLSFAMVSFRVDNRSQLCRSAAWRFLDSHTT
jgi:hypothetical protein